MTIDVLERRPGTAFFVPEPPPAICHGPTWQRNPDWDGKDALDEFVLPELTLGWQIIAWIQKNLLAEEADAFGRQYPFNLTFEQRRFLLWWYAIDETGRFAYRTGVFQRLKGAGKDPLAAVIAAVEFLGPCRFAGWSTKDKPELGIERRGPVGKEHPRAWVQIAAVSRRQTQNTMLLFKSLFTEECKAAHGIGKHQMGQFQITAHSGQRRIEAVTSSPASLEGGRPTLVIGNETHWWNESNAGHAMFRVIEDNITKAKGAGARVLAITNAYDPSQDSVAQRMREAWEDEDSGLAFSTGMMYDSLEAAPEAVLRPELPDDYTPQQQEAATRGYLRKVFEGVRGDAVWLDIDSMIDKVLRRSTKPADARRFWFNQVRGAEDAWVLADAVDAAEEPMVKGLRARASDKNDVRIGWVVESKEPIVMFFDGSKSDDSTALIGVRVSDGYSFVIGVWEKPRGEGQVKKAWLAPRGEVAERIEEAFDRFNVVAFFGDPSHADDEDGSRYWDPMLDAMHRKYSHRLKWWAQKGGDKQHSVLWDMASPMHTAEHASAAMVVVEQLERRENGTDEGPFDPAFLHDGHPKLKRHLKNARRNPLGKNLVGMTKEGRESAKKIDLGVALVGAQMLRTIVLNGPQEEKVTGKQAGEVW